MRFYEIETEKRGYLYMDYGEAATIDMHGHGAIEILIIHKGQREVVVGGEKRILNAGEGCFSTSFCAHSYSVNEGTWGYAIVGDKLFFERHFNSFEGKTPPRFFKFKDFNLLEKLYEIFKCKTSLQYEESSKFVIHEGIVGILLGSIAEQNKFCKQNADKQALLIFDVLKYAHNNLEKDLSLNALALLFHYSERHLSRVLFKHLSESWTNYINRIRVLQAHEVLKANPHSSVLDVAISCGFNSINTFYRAYKKEFSQLPRR